MAETGHQKARLSSHNRWQQGNQTVCKAYKCKRDSVIETLQEINVLQQLAFIRLLPTAEENEQWVFVTSLCHVLRR